MTTDAAELDINLSVRQLPDSEKWKVRLTVLSGPDFRSPHAVLGCVCADRAAAERVGDAVALALQAHPPRLEGEQVIVDVPTLGQIGEGGEYPEA